MSVNSEIRKAILKEGGDTFTVTLYLGDQSDQTNNSEILECCKSANVCNIFKKLENTNNKKF